MLPSPFRVASNLFLAAFRICGYFLVFLVEFLWYLRAGRRYYYKIGEAWGHFGRASVDALASIFESGDNTRKRR